MLRDGVRRRLVDDQLVLGGIGVREPLAESFEGERRTRGGGRKLTEKADLPEDEENGDVDLPAVEEKCGRLVRLAARLGGVEPQIRDEAVLRRDAREHARTKAFRPRPFDRRVTGVDEDSRVPVERDADVCAAAHLGQDLLDHGGVRLAPVLRDGVVARERARVRVQSFQPLDRHRIEHEMEHHVCPLDHRPRLRGQLRAELDARADDCERPGRRASRLSRPTRERARAFRTEAGTLSAARNRS
jgi:hypothetical protein